MSDPFWQDVAYQLLEMNLNNDSLNGQILTKMFEAKPAVLAEMDFGDGIGVNELDRKLFSGRADIVEVREAKPHELWECIPCGKTFRRKDNRDRHLRSNLHGRRLKKWEDAKKQDEVQVREAE